MNAAAGSSGDHLLRWFSCCFRLALPGWALGEGLAQRQQDDGSDMHVGWLKVLSSLFSPTYPGTPQCKQACPQLVAHMMIPLSAVLGGGGGGGCLVELVSFAGYALGDH